MKLNLKVALLSLITLICFEASAAYPVKFVCKGESQEDSKKVISFTMGGIVGENPGSRITKFKASMNFSGSTKFFGNYKVKKEGLTANKTIMNSSLQYDLVFVPLNRSIMLSASIDDRGRSGRSGELTLVDGVKMIEERFDLTCK